MFATTNNNKVANAGILKSLIFPALGGGATALGFDQLNYGGVLSDAPWTTNRKVNLGKNVLLSGLLYRQMPGASALKKDLMLGGGISSPMVSNMLVEGPATMSSYRDSTKNIFERFNSLSPTQKTLTVAATGLTAALAVPALMNLSAAAKRLADGRAVRLSTSIRKRRNQDKDLVIGVQPIPGESEEIQPEQVAQPEESKGFLSKIFG